VILIQPIGELLIPNKDGYFDRAIDPSQPIQAIWQKPLKLCVKEIQARLPNLIHSIYLRGSVARGSAVKGISDIDIVIVTKNTIVDFDKSWERPFIKVVRQRYHFVDDIEFGIVSYQSLFNFSRPIGVRILLKLQGRCIKGEDLIPRLPEVYPNKSSFIHIPYFHAFQKRIKFTLQTKEVYLPVFVPWVAKRYIRTGFELCIEKENFFTRDLYKCYEVFGKYYPEKKHPMYNLLGQALEPTLSQDQLLSLVNTFGEWLQSEVHKKYPEYF